MKSKLLQFYLHLMRGFLGQERLENFLFHGCRKNLIRKCLRLGALAYEYSSHLTEHTIRLAPLNHNYQIYVDLLEPPGVSSYFFGYADILPCMDILLERGDIFIDAGANRGQYTLFAASIVGEQGKVLAFEPNPTLCDHIKNSVNVNKWEHFVTVDQHVLWNQSHQSMKLYCSINPRNSGTSSVIFHGYDITRDNYVEVDTITLNDASKKHNISFCHFLKVDVERAEHEVLQGFSEFLEKHLVKYILIEMYCHSSAHNLLLQWGYKGFLADVGQGLVDIEHIQDDRFGDYLFISPEASQDFAQQQALIHNRLSVKRTEITWSQ